MMKNTAMKLNVQVLVVLLAGLLCGCNGGSGTIEPTADPAILNGGLDVTGAPLADLAAPDVTGDLDEDKWAVRVIDPTESVDSIALDHSDEDILPVNLDLAGEYLLRFELLPAVDLSGDGASVTPLVLDVPVLLEPAATTAAAVSVELIPPADALSRVTAQGSGYLIRLSYSLTGPGQMQALVELDWANQRLRRDTNGDGQLDDEAYFTDSDRNGIGDNRQEGMKNMDPQAGPVTDQLVISAIDFGSGVLTADGTDYHIDESTQVLGTENQPLTLVDLAVGQMIEMKSRRSKHGLLYAQRIKLIAQ